MSAPHDPPLPQATVTAGAPGTYPYAGPPPADYQPLIDLASPKQITLAAFLTGPLTAVWLLARNFARMRSPQGVVATLVLGLLGTAGVFALAFFLPERAPPFLVSAPLVAVTWLIAHRVQGPRYDAHVARLGPTTGTGRIAVIAVAALVLQAGAVIGGLVAYGAVTRGPNITVAGGSEVYYRDGATRADAERVGAVLEQIGYLAPDHKASVTVQRPRGYATVGLVVNDAALAGEFDADFRGFADALSADAFDGNPVDLWLIDTDLDVRRRLPWHAPTELD
ncbi:MAG: hypothetical protein IPL61_30185 [Myxococcales bacterium]|nr:hypothetical protein [Myxococcales bacterium]